MKKVIRKVKRTSKNVLKVKKASGWSLKKTISEMRLARSNGMSFSDYANNSCWKLNKKEIDELNKKLKRKETIKNNIIEKIIKNTGWDKKTARLELNKAKKNGIANVNYLKYKCWDLNEEELLELKEQIKLKNEKKKENEEWYVNVVMEKTGWNRDKTIKRLEKAKDLGYTARKFITQGIYGLSDEEFKKLEPYKAPEKKIDKEEQVKSIKTLADYKKTIMKENNWSEGKYSLEYLKAYNNCGCSYSEYYLYNLYKLSSKEQREYITQDLHIKMQIRYCDYAKGLEYFEKKSLFNTTFKDFVKRKWFTNENLTFKDFEKNIKNLDEIIYKPLDNLGGEGVKKYKISKDKKENRKTYDSITKNEKAIIEECIVQNDEIAKFWPKTVNSIRIMTLCKNGKVNILNSVIKFGTGKYADNLAQGGIAAGIDIKTGKICTAGVNKKGEIFERHPNSNVKFEGFQIPHWDKVIKECEKAAKVIKTMPYIGWDISITNKGEVEIIEGNHNQAGFLVQYPYAILKQEGKRHTIEPFLWFDKK